MKTLSLLVVFMVFVSPGRSQDEGNPAPQEGAPPVTPARIIGVIPDGTPPPPAPPKPAYVVPARNVLATTTQEQGGRTITIQKIKPIALPAPPAPPPTSAANTSLRNGLAETGDGQTGTRMLSLGATVYRFKDSPPRTHVQYRPQSGAEPITFWSSADFSLISGIQGIVATDGRTYSLFMAWSVTDTTRIASGHPPDIPAFADGPASFALVGTPPADPSVLIPVQSLHELYNSEYVRLKAAYEGRERARIQHEAGLKANPPKPKNIVLNYWRTEKPAQTKGGNK